MSETNISVDNNTCGGNWRKVAFEKYNCKGIALNSGNGDITIKGEVITQSNNPKIVFWAPNAPTYNSSFSGSGLPYYNPEQAYENTPNVGAVIAENRQFSFKIFYPNSYYVGLGSVYMSPRVNIKICEEGSDEGEVHTILLGEGIPFRSLTYPPVNGSVPRKDPLFYYGTDDLPVIGQEQILRNSAYPDNNQTPQNFWGLKPRS